MTLLVRTPWEADASRAPAKAVPPSPESVAATPKRRGRRPAAATSANAAPAWLWHHLTITGPTGNVTVTYQTSAQGLAGQSALENYYSPLLSSVQFEVQ